MSDSMVTRCLSKTKQLQNTFGGKWKHVPFQRVWFDEESDSQVIVVCCCSGDDACSCGGRPCFYGKPGSGWIYWGVDRVKILGGVKK